MAASVVVGDAVVLEQNAVYRARLCVVPPYGPLASEDMLRSKLGDQGFSEVVFYPKTALPANWPAEERADDSGFMGEMHYLQGRFVLSSRRVPLSKMGSQVALRGMWLQEPPPEVEVPPGPYRPVDVAPPLPPVLPPPPPEPENGGGAVPGMPLGLKVAASVVGLGVAFVVARWALR
jgi:hypothetical protein